MLDRRERASRRPRQRRRNPRRRPSPDRRGSSTPAYARATPANRSLGVDDLALRAPILARRRALDPSAQRLAHQLHAIADAQHRNAELEDTRDRTSGRRRHKRSPGRRTGSARSGASSWTRAAVMSCRTISQYTLLLAHPPGDELRVLRAKVEHQHALGGSPAQTRRRSRPCHRCGHQRPADNRQLYGSRPPDRWTPQRRTIPHSRVRSSRSRLNAPKSRPFTCVAHPQRPQI